METMQPEVIFGVLIVFGLALRYVLGKAMKLKTPKYDPSRGHKICPNCGHCLTCGQSLDF